MIPGAVMIPGGSSEVNKAIDEFRKSSLSLGSDQTYTESNQGSLDSLGSDTLCASDSTEILIMISLLVWSNIVSGVGCTNH